MRNQKGPGWFVSAIVGSALALMFLFAARRPTAEAFPQVVTVPVIPTVANPDTAQHCVNPDSTHAIGDAALRGFVIRIGWCRTLVVPEFNDTQRFHHWHGPYGPVANSIASPELSTLTTAAQFEDRWVLVAIVYVDMRTVKEDQYAEIPLTGGPPTVERAAGGTGYGHDPSRTAPNKPGFDGLTTATKKEIGAHYQNLGLRGGANCFFLRHTVGSPPDAGWSAIVGPCVTDPASNRVGMPRPVVVDTTLANAAGIPPVTRFIESTAARTLLGVRCASSWCVIGTDLKTNIPVPAHHFGAGDPVQSSVKGWFDDQRIGLLNASQPFGIIAGVSRASVVPVANLDTYTVADFTNNWVHTATVYLQPGRGAGARAAAEAYLNKFNITAGRPTYIWIRRDSFVDRTVGSGRRVLVDRWRARVSADTLGPRWIRNAYFVVKRTVHPGYLVPATARFRWFDEDEWVWTRCDDDGCCLVEKFEGDPDPP